VAVIGIGIDLVDIVQAERLLGRWGERVLHRTLTEGEREYVRGAAYPARHFAVRLAAKEAVFKALQTIPGAHVVSWRQIEVIRAESGHPSIRLHGEAQRLADGASVSRVSLSLSHSDQTAGAVALVESV
jgi:holo-[acyl-carrier protein] synthase